ncbi:hypothetical protein [Ammonifex thiophilus]|uniref:Uncharacterized protein n=1 Tax=Ammonifex thiophilus TaxID=444093 RepID=A0A3D8P2X8_9THEO|nr:hypothetical protein [Ammonifex thiophilus]RDV80411.1 hypothetical protein DXX99_10920 [Ammonifex thiophilus]
MSQVLSVPIADLLPPGVRARLEGMARPPVAVTRHALERFSDWRRGAGVEAPDPEAAGAFLRGAALKGRFVRRLPGGAWEVEHQGLYLAVKREGRTLVVLTFNGDRAWRHWCRKQRRKERGRARWTI